jgi:hypothetical protein
MDHGAPLLSRPGVDRVGRETPQAPRFRFVLACAVVGCKIQALLFRAVQGTHAFGLRVAASGQRLFGAMCAEALTLEEKGLLTVRIYDYLPVYRTIGDALHSWEEPWFASRLPMPPARVLVGACGTGREAVALAGRGFRVHAFEPAPEFVAESRRRLGPRAEVVRLSYEELNAIVLDGASLPASELRDARYDAIILGSGSLTHVLDPREQERLLRSLSILCPQGPILASFFCDEESAGDAVSIGRAARVGRRIGRTIAKWRGLRAGSSTRLSYRAHSGFAYTFTPREIELLAQKIGRELAWEQGKMQPFHYATFLPPGRDP